MKYRPLGLATASFETSPASVHAIAGTQLCLPFPCRVKPPDPRQGFGFTLFVLLFCYAAGDAEGVHVPAPAGMLEPRWRGISCRRLAGETSGPLEGSVEERHVCPQRMRACNKQYLDRLVERFCIWGQRVIILGQCVDATDILAILGQVWSRVSSVHGFVFHFFFSCRVDHRLQN
jgi:hypothetical protein